MKQGPVHNGELGKICECFQYKSNNVSVPLLMERAKVCVSTKVQKHCCSCIGNIHRSWNLRGIIWLEDSGLLLCGAGHWVSVRTCFTRSCHLRLQRSNLEDENGTVLRLSPWKMSLQQTWILGNTALKISNLASRWVVRHRTWKQECSHLQKRCVC
jgi:hypothetical protein